MGSEPDPGSHDTAAPSDDVDNAAETSAVTPRAAKQPVAEAVAAPAVVRERECAGCRENIPARARRCPHCGTFQGYRRFVPVGLKSAGALLTVLSLAFALRQLTGLIGDALTTRSDIRTRIAAAERLVELGEHAAAWQLLEPVADSRHDGLRRMRLAVARSWILFPMMREGVTMRDIADRLTPWIAASAGTGPARERAEHTALLGHIQLLRSREERIPADPLDSYRAALDLDAECGLAHLLLGSYLLNWTDEFERGLSHLQRAVALQQAGQLRDVRVRERQLRAIASYRRSNPFLPNPRNTEGSVALVRALDDIRRSDGHLPEEYATLDRTEPNRYWGEAQSIYQASLRDTELGARILEALPERDHVALLQWLQDQSPSGAADPWLSAWLGRLFERLGERQHALEAYQQHDQLPPFLGQVWDSALIRLTGEPYRPLRERDPWAHFAQVLGSAAVEDTDYQSALERVRTYMENHRIGARFADAEAATALRAGLANPLLDDGGAVADDERGTTHVRLGLHLATLLSAQQQAGEAVSLLSDLDARLADGHSMRGELLVALAVAHVRRGGRSHLDAAVARLSEAVEAAAYADWARIRWFGDLQPLHNHAGYAALLARHGRTVPGAFR